MVSLGMPAAAAIASGADRRSFVTTPLFRSAAALAYVVVLHQIYRARITPAFAYLGFTYRAPGLDELILVAIPVTVLAVVLPSRLKRPSDLILWILFVVLVVPSIAVPQYTEVLEQGQALTVSLVVAGCFLGVVLGARAPLLRFVPVLDVSPTSFSIVLAVASAIVYGYLLATIGFDFNVVSFADVYDVRSDYKDQLSTTAPLLGYLVPWQGNVVNPIFILRGIYCRHLPLLVGGLAGQLVLYSTTGFKTLLFSTPAMMAVSALFRRRSAPSGASIVGGAIGLSAIAVALDTLFHSITITSLFVRRLLIVPGLLTAVYVRVFSVLPQTHLTQSGLLLGGHYPYTTSPGQVVGRAYFNRPDSNANANLFADGFLNFGYLGVFAAAAVLLLILRVVDSASRGLPVAISGLVFFMATITLSNSGILTTMLTHGLGLALVMVSCIPRAGWFSKPGDLTEVTDGARTSGSAAPGTEAPAVPPRRPPARPARSAG